MAGGKLNLTRRRGERREREIESEAFLIVVQPPDSRIGECTPLIACIHG